MSSKFIARLIGIVALALLASCSTQPEFQSEQLSPEQQAANQALHSWKIKGKVGLRGIDSSGKEFSNSAYLNWQQCQQQYELRLSGPLGQGAAVLRGDDNQVQLQTSDGRYDASSPETLMRQQLGWSIPLTQLQYWVRGLPAPGSFQQHSGGFKQQGWLISVPRWQHSGGQQLPAKLIAQHPQLKLTLILKQWQLQPNCSSQTRL